MGTARVHEDTNPWYKEPWPWFLMAGPAIVVVACMVTIYLAYSNYDMPMSGATKRGLQVVPATEQISSSVTIEVQTPIAQP